MKLVEIAKKFAKPIGFGAAGIAAIGYAISSVLRGNAEYDYDSSEVEEESDGCTDEWEEASSEESPVDDAE